jgi:hypothetical protein
LEPTRNERERWAQSREPCSKECRGGTQQTDEVFLLHNEKEPKNYLGYWKWKAEESENLGFPSWHEAVKVHFGDAKHMQRSQITRARIGSCWSLLQNQSQKKWVQKKSQW